MTIRPSTRAHVAAYIFFLVVALLITWPLVTALSTHFAGYPFGDAHEMTRHIWWFKYAIQHGQPLIFQPLLGYPDGMQGVILWSDPLQFFPAWLFAFVMPLPAAYNLQCLLTMALNGWAAYFLVWKLTGGRFPALVAGLIFMAAPVMQGHLAGGHGGLLVQWPLPLLAYSLIRLRQISTQPSDFAPQPANRPLFSRLSLSTQYSALSTFFFVLLPLGHTLQLIYAGLPLIGVFGVMLIVKREWRALARLVVVVVIGSAILALFLLPVLQSTFGTEAYTDEGGGVAFSIDLLGVVTPSFNHPLYGQLAYTRQVLGVNLVEGSSYIGLIAGLLALAALWKKPAARWWLLLALVGWILALGPLLKIFDTPVNVSTGEYSTFVTLPWAMIADLPGFNLARTPGRFGFVLALAVAVMAGYGAAVVSGKLSGISYQSSAKDETARTSKPISRFPLSTQHSVLSAILFLLLLFDYQSYWPLPTYPAEIPAAVHDLAGRDDVRAVFDLPWDNVLAAKDALWLQTAHEKPLIAGQVTRKTPVSPAKLTILEQTLDPALLNEAGADVIVLHKQYDGESALATIARTKLGEPFHEDDRLALWDVPEATQPPQVSVVFPSGRTMQGTLDFYTEALETGADRAVVDIYIPETGWIDLGVSVETRISSSVLLLDDHVFYRHDASPYADNLSLPLSQPGYHRITLAIEPLCPSQRDPTWVCGFGSVSSLTMTDFVSAAFVQSVQFDRGVSLLGVHLSRPQENVVWPMLWWHFEQPLTDQDIRFVKVFDADGKAVVDGLDMSLGVQSGGNQLIDPLTILLDDLSPGTYRVCVGWYSYPDLTRFAVLSDVEGSQDNLACVGEFSIPTP